MTKTTRLAGIGLAAALNVTIPMAANAASVTIDSVAQRWPWNNKVDITYTVTDAQVRSAGVYYGIRFSLSANGQTYSFEGNEIGASTESGNGSRQYTVTWTAPEGIVCTDASLTATLVATNVPSGTDYMVVDLTTGAVAYEGLCATQAASNDRYNTGEFKTDKLVLRKVPRTADSGSLPNGPFSSGYPTGDSVNYSSGNRANPSKTWTTDRDYYIGVFHVTQYQYQKLYGSNPSLNTASSVGHDVAQHPVDNVSTDDVRGENASRTSPPMGSAANAGTFLQRLNFLTGNRFGFDLPTEAMFEIAARAGATTTYSWGDAMDASRLVCSDNSGNKSAVVGSCQPNNWGLYDMFGNVWNRALDSDDKASMATLSNVFTPRVTGTSVRLRGGSYTTASSHVFFRASDRSASCPCSTKGADGGFRVAVIAK